MEMELDINQKLSKLPVHVCVAYNEQFLCFIFKNKMLHVISPHFLLSDTNKLFFLFFF